MLLLGDVQEELQLLEPLAATASLLVDVHDASNARRLARLSVPARDLQEPRKVAHELRAIPRAEGYHHVSIRPDPASLPRNWAILGLLEPIEMVEVTPDQLVNVVVASMVVRFRGLQLDAVGAAAFFERLPDWARRGAPGQERLHGLLPQLAVTHGQRAQAAMSRGQRAEAASHLAAALTCAGVKRRSRSSTTVTTKYGLDVGASIGGMDDLWRLVEVVGLQEVVAHDGKLEDVAGRVVEEGRAAWAERQMVALADEGFPFVGSVPDPVPLSDYVSDLYLDGMRRVQRAAEVLSPWVFLSNYTNDHVAFGAWNATIVATPPHLLDGIAAAAAVTPADLLAELTAKDGDAPWPEKVFQALDESCQRAADVLTGLLGDEE